VHDLIPTTTDNFAAAALAIPDRVAAFLAAAPPVPVLAEAMARLDLMAQYAARIRADTDVVNAIQYGKLRIIARYGNLCPPLPPDERGALGGRGNKAPPGEGGAFGHNTMARYRGIGKSEDRIDDYRAAVDVEGVNEVLSVGGFLRFVNGTGGAHVSANTGEPEWYTPAPFVEAARRALGEIDLDPASSALAQRTVRAARFFTIQDDGLALPWSGRVFLNPPYAAAKVQAFVDRLCEHVEGGAVAAAVLLTNNATETAWFQRAGALAVALCLPAGRIAFLDENGEPGAPLQGQALLYFGPHRGRFAAAFGTLGLLFHRGTS
jgi:ParB family chromosome partitioning protein